MEIQAYVSEQVLKITEELHYTPIDDKFCVYELITTTTSEGKVNPRMKRRISSSRVEGIAEIEVVKAYEKKGSPIQNLTGYFFYPKSLREKTAKLGYPLAVDLFRDELKQTKEKYPGFDKETGFYTAFTNSSVSVEDLAHTDSSSGWLTDRNGNAIPEGLQFCYINGRIHDGCYDLQKAVEILRKNPRITPLYEGRYDSDPDADNPEELEVKLIPYYNRDESHSSFLEFIYEPTPEEAQKLRDKMLSYGGQYPSARRYEAAFDLDVLGLRKGGAAYFETYHDSKRNVYREGDDD